MKKAIEVWKIENRKPKDLIEYERNPRKISKERFEKLKKRIESQGFRVPPSLTKDGRILAGHQRIRAAIDLGLGDIDIPVSVASRKLTKKEEQEIVVSDNVSWGEFDEDILANEFEIEDLIEWGLEDLSFFDENTLNVETIGDDEVPDGESVPTITVKGDLYELGEHRLLCGDSTDSDQVSTLMNGEKADMVFTDPPYNAFIVGGCKDKRDRNYQSGKKIKNDSMKEDDFRQFLKDSFSACYAVTKSGGIIYICHADSEVLNFRSAMKESGWLLKQCLIWAKHAFVFSRQDYHWQHEPILYGWKDGSKHKFYGERNQGTVWNFNRPDPSDKTHPTMKPIELIEKALLNSSMKEQICLDLFGGSGSTLIACEKTERKCFMMELDEHYCDVIVKRYIDFCKKNKRPYSVKRNGEICKDFENEQ